MIEATLSIFGEDFGTTAATATILIFIAVLAAATFKQQKVDIGKLLVALFSGIGTMSGLKIVLLTYLLSAENLGSLADDRPTLMIGGFATLLLSTRQCWIHGRQAAGYSTTPN